MGFTLQVSNSLEQLAATFCKNVRSTHRDPFQQVCIITQTEGMNNWLKLQMAEKLGIAANYQFWKPNDLINKIYYLLVGPSNDVLSADNLNWLLFKLLAEEDFIKKYPAIAAYYTSDGDDSDIKRMGLAEKIAD